MKRFKTFFLAPLVAALLTLPSAARAGEDAAVGAYRQKAAAGDKNAQFELGLIYHKGSNGVLQDIDEALKWYTLSAEQGDVSAMNNIGVIYVDNLNRPAEGFKWVERAAMQGDAFSQRVLGMYYHEGTGVAPDALKAAGWFERSANQGDPTACFFLGSLYYGGEENFAVDMEKARGWFERGAELDNASSLRMLGMMYYDGKGGLEQDFVAARECLERAARRGNAAAQVYAGRLFLEDHPGVARDEARAKMWLLRATENGMANNTKSMLATIPADVKPSGDATIRIAADDLIRAFAADAEAANATYRGQVIEVTRGAGRSQVNMVGSRADVRFTVAGSPVVLTCVVVGKGGSLSLNTGENYGYRGVCGGMSPMLGVIVVNDCENVQVR